MSSSAEWSLIVSAERCLHPQACLQDWYKLFFQAWFGPGHLITDEAAARVWLLYELAGALNYDDPLWQPIGTDYGRVHLGAWKMRGVSVDVLLQGFVASAGKPPLGSLAAWKELWLKVTVWLMREGLATSQDSTHEVVTAALENGATVHHSKHYHQLYQPHYRVLSVEQWKQIKTRYNL